MSDSNNSVLEDDYADDGAVSSATKAYVDRQIKNSHDSKSELYKKKWKNAWRSASPITKASFFLSCATALATIIYAAIAYFQLSSMRESVSQMIDSGNQTERLLCLNQQQLEQARKQATDTHTLADQAVTQATQTTRLAKDTHELAVQARNQANAAREIATNSILQSSSTKTLADNALKQTTISSDQLEISERPLVYSIPTPVDSITYNSNGANFAFNFKSFNFGLTPATNVSVYAKMFPVNLDPNEREREKATMCSSAKRVTGFDTTIFPKDTYVTKIGIRYSWQDIQKNSLAGFFNVQMAVCTVYTSTLPGGNEYFSSHVYDIYRTEKTHPGTYAFIPGQETAKEDILVGGVVDDRNLID